MRHRAVGLAMPVARAAARAAAWARPPWLTVAPWSAWALRAARAAGLGLGLLLACALPATAREPSAEPILRVEAGMHTTLIRRIAVDAPRNRLVTCSDDKTVRVWQMPEARLVATLRPPIDTGHEGQLFAVAVSPDGKTVVTGGWTGWDWDGSASLYFFDVASGDLVKRVGGFKDAIHALHWVRDGEHLLVGLQGRGGLHRLRVADGRIVASDTQYLDKIMEIDERPSDGLVAVVALDGNARLYGRDLALLGRRPVPGGSKPSSARFSPDGRQLAVGFIDRPALTVLNSRDLGEAFRPAAEGAPALRDQASFTSVAWSSDGRHLYAGGDYRGSGANPLYRWDEGGRGALQALPLADNRITEIQQMPGGAIAFAAEDPGLGIVGPNGKRSAWRGPENLDFSGAQAQIQLSADGAVVRYPLQRQTGSGPVSLHSFSPLLPGDQPLGAIPKAELFAPVTQAPGLVVESWKDSFTPTVNGQKPRLDEYEMSRSYALAPQRRAVLLGTEWALRLLDEQARELWSVKLPAVASAVNISRDGRLAVAALSDGTLRWFRMSDGREELAYFPHRNGRDWIAWVTDGYYMSSVSGDNFVGWHLNRGRDLAADFFRAVQFDRILYRPDAVAAAFRASNTPTPRGAALKALGAEFEIRKLADIAPPRLRLQPVELTTGADGRQRAVLELRAEGSKLDIKDLSVFVNNIPVTPAGERRLRGAETQQFVRRLVVELADSANQIRVEAFNGVAMGVAETFVARPDIVRLAPPPGDLYVLAVGVNVFPRLPAQMHLAYAVRDAAELARTLQARSAGQFARVHVRLLTDESEVKPDRAAVLRALEFVQQARPQDTAVVFLASNGVSDAAGNYYFVPRDARPEDVQALDKARNAPSLLPWTAFFDALRGTAGRRLLIVDTCQARSIEGRFEAHSLMKRSAASLFSLVVASKGDEESQEYPPGKHGLFTYALLQALTPDSDSNRDGVVSLSEVFAAAQPVVERLRDKRTGAQTPQIVAPVPLSDLPLLRAR
ncbi:MAG: caspase family protein [Rubrivivax sp.]|nr:caspase family protein [Rubrivivax sp.]